MEEPSAHKYARPFPWLFAAVYTLHLLDEALVAGSLPAWATQHGFHFTIENWLWVSSISLVLFTAAVVLVARGAWRPWVLVSLAVHVSLHALIHLGASIWWRSLAPGTISGVVLALPLAVWTFCWAWNALDRRVLVWAAAIGAVSFQAPWDFAARLIFGLPFWIAPTN